MRRTRWLFLVAIIFIVFAVGATYLKRKGTIEREAPARPKSMAKNLDGNFDKWTYSDQKGTTPHVTIRAEHAHESSGSTAIDLEGVDMKLYNKHGPHSHLTHTRTPPSDPLPKPLT